MLLQKGGFVKLSGIIFVFLKCVRQIHFYFKKGTGANVLSIIAKQMTKMQSRSLVIVLLQFFPMTSDIAKRS